MKLLMITRKVDLEDSSPAGFTYNWVKKLGEKLEELYVITWQKSDRGDLPKNIEIISLPNNKFFKIFVLQFRLLKILPKVDGVFCHQNPEYTILIGPLAKIFRKRIISWYTHKAVNWRRRLMELLADKILTASSLSFRKPFFPNKVEVTGHGIDINYFCKSPYKHKDEKFHIISVGRISPIKNYETLIKAIDILVNEKNKNNIELIILGSAVLKSDNEYLRKIKKLSESENLIRGKYHYIEIVGRGIPYRDITTTYWNSDLMVNLSQTGSVDKAVLEAMACETLVLTSNEAFKDILKDERLMFKPRDYNDLADKIINLMNLSDEGKKKIGQSLRKAVVDNHNLDKLVGKILALYEE